MAPLRAFVMLCVAGSVAGCSGGSGVGDAGADAAVIASPAAPALPTWPCPTGWREVVDGDVTTCDPFPAGGALDCPVDAAHFPGEPGCTRVGTVCPAGEWPEGLPGGRPILYVRAGGAAGGDGTQASPYGTIAAALAGAPPGAIIALGKGTFDEAVSLAAGLALWGACVAETRVASTAPSDLAGTINVTGAGVEVRNLQVGGARPGLWLGAAGASVVVEDVAIASATDVGWLALTGSGTGRNLIIRDTQPRASNGRYGRGLNVQGADVDITRAAFERNRDAGVFAGGVGTTLALVDVVVRDTQGQASDGANGRGLWTIPGAHVDVTRVAFERNRDRGVFASGIGTTVALADVVVRDTQGLASDGQFGFGLDANFGAQVDVTRATFERNRYVGVIAVDMGTTVALADVVIRDTQGQASDGSGGRGLGVQLGAHVDAARTALDRNRDVGVFAAGTGSTVALADVVVRDTQGQASDAARGGGLEVQSGALVDVVRAAFERNREVGVIADGVGTTLALADVVVRDTHGQESDGWFGRGLSVQNGAHADVTRAAFVRNRDVGVFAIDTGTTVMLADVVVTETREQECAATDACAWDVTCAVGSYDGAALDLRLFLLSRSAMMGVQLGGGGTVDLHEGEVSENAIGANVQTEGFDVTRLQDQVVFRDNDVNLDSSALAVPEPGDPLGP